MNRSTLHWMALAGALLAPAAGYAQIPCTRDGLKTATDLYIGAQTQGGDRMRPASRDEWGGQLPSTWPLGYTLGGLPVSPRVSFVENFEMISGDRLIGKPMNIDQHRSLLDTARCETFTEVLVSDQANPYALGTRLHVERELVSEIEMIWTTTGDSGFDADRYLKSSAAEDWGPIPVERRDTRAALESAANAYLDALLKGTANVEPWGFPCKRTAADGSCQAGLPVPAVNIANRHYVVDETIGAVAVLCTFGADPASGRIRTPDAHVFRVEHGQVRFVHALMHLR